LEGLLLAAFLGLIALLAGTKQRNTSILGKVPETNIYRSLEHNPEGETYPGLLILRFDGSLFFANSHDFVVAVQRAVAATDPKPKVLLIDGESINDIDATAVMTIREMEGQLAKDGVEVWLAQIKTPVLDIMKRAEVEKAIPAEHIFPSVQTAVDAYLGINSGVE
jgi:MFS superfamily sulfate permease-like transporter